MADWVNLKGTIEEGNKTKKSIKLVVIGNSNRPPNRYFETGILMWYFPTNLNRSQDKDEQHRLSVNSYRSACILFEGVEPDWLWHMARKEFFYVRQAITLGAAWVQTAIPYARN